MLGFARLFLVSLFLLSGAAAAQPCPSQPIRLIAPFPPGGSVDIMARLIAEPLGAQLFDPLVSRPEEAGRFIASEVQRFGALIKARKITAE